MTAIVETTAQIIHRALEFLDITCDIPSVRVEFSLFLDPFNSFIHSTLGSNAGSLQCQLTSPSLPSPSPSTPFLLPHSILSSRLTFIPYHDHFQLRHHPCPPSSNSRSAPHRRHKVWRFHSQKRHSIPYLHRFTSNRLPSLRFNRRCRRSITAFLLLIPPCHLRRAVYSPSVRHRYEHQVR